MSIYRTPDQRVVIQRARRFTSWQIALRTGVAGLAFITAQTAWANPGGGNVVAGNATISGQGTDRVRIDQSSDRVIINWDNFSIGAGQAVDFRQPGARSIALNRVTGPEISQIMGELTANGQIYLINGNGIVFGKDARVDVAGLVATSADIGNDAFMSGGSLRFGTPGRSGAKVVNYGTITVRDAGIAAFVAPQVANDGIITAHMGKIAFGGAQAFTLDLHGDNLIRFQVGDAVTKLDDKGALVDIGGGVVDARGGTLLITASAARDLVNQSVRIGTPQASSMQVGTDGRVSLVAAKVTITAPSEVQVGKNVAMDLSSGTNAAVTGGRPQKGGTTSNIGWANVLDGDVSTAPGIAMATSGTGGTLTINAARTILDGTINLDGGKTGGTAHITGSDFLSFGSILSASGAEAGGNIQLDAGGFSLAGRITVNAGLGKGGNVDIHTTRRAIDTGDAFIDASGLHGGSIRYTSDQQIISSGKFRASGSHGFGGLIDVSAARLDLFSAQFYAQGGIRGGRVRLGGEFQGGKALSVDELINARTLVATDSVVVDVSAIGMRGNGGEIVLWSDEKTTFLGTAISRGGMVGGLGGQIEISGKDTLVYRGTVATARDGQRGGKLLLDPKNIIIADASNAPSQYALVLQAFSSSFPGFAAPGTGLESGDEFGTSVSLDGNRLAVGAPLDDGASGSLIAAGAVYLFTFADTGFASPVLSAIIGSGYSGGKNISVSQLQGDDRFGQSVSLSGTRLAVGAPFGNGANDFVPNAGEVYLFSFADLEFNAGTVAGILGTGFSGPASLNVSRLDANDAFGGSVSLNGNRIAVGAQQDDGIADDVISAGAVYLFTFADAAFNSPVLEAIIGNGYTGGKNVSIALDVADNFGSAVALSGFGLGVGAYGDGGQGNSGSDYGAAYLFSFASADFTSAALQSTLGFGYTGPNDLDMVDLGAGDRFGESLGLIGSESFAVLAPGDDGFFDGAPDTGAAYLFNFSDAFFQGPSLTARIGADYGSLGGRNLSLNGLNAGETLSSLALDFNAMVLGSSSDTGRSGTSIDAGAVYLLTFDGSNFNNGRLAATLGVGYADVGGLSLLGTGLRQGTGFGSSVSLDGNRMAVGAQFDNGAGDDKFDVGAVYLFSFGDSQFSAPVLQSIIGSGYSGGKNLSLDRLAANDQFGTSVSLDGLRLAVGAPRDDGLNDTSTDAGAVYLFTFAGPAFENPNLARVLDFGSITGGPIAAAGAMLGSGVSLQDDFLAVGAAGDPGSSGSQIDVGAVHIFNMLASDFSVTPERLVSIGAGLDVDVAGLEDFDAFGTSVSLDGLQLAVGAPGDGGALSPVSDAGAVYLFTFGSNYSGGSLAATIGADYGMGNDFDPGVSSFDAFGVSVSLRGLQLAVGASGDSGADDMLNRAGAVYLFTFANPGFSGLLQTTRIGSGYAGTGDYALNLLGQESGFEFGSAVSLDGGRLVVGAVGDAGRNSSAINSGAVYLFTFSSPELLFLPRLVDVLGAGYSGFNNYSVPGLRAEAIHQFGTSVALDGLRLAVGAPEDMGADLLASVGAVYLFSFATEAFDAPVLEAIVGSGYSGGKNVAVASLDAGDRFGEAVALRDNRLAVGAPQDDGLANAVTNSGAVYLFTFSDAFFSGGTLQGRIGADYVGANDLSLGNINTGDAFGASLALDGTRLAVGASLDDGDEDSLLDAGAVYLFSFAGPQFAGGALEGIVGAGYAGGNNVSVANLAGGNGDAFGAAVALQGTRLIVGAPFDDGAGDAIGDSGAAYIVDFADLGFTGGTVSTIIGNGYTGMNDIDLTEIEASDHFGSSVSIDGSGLAVGAAQDGGTGNLVPLSGAVYLFSDRFGPFELRWRIGAGYGGFGDLSVGGLRAGDRFGSAVALDGNRLVVGSPEDTGVNATSSGLGAVRLFTSADSDFESLGLAGTMGSGYGPQQNLSVGPASGAGLGSAVSLHGTQLAIGAPGDSGFGNSGPNLGAVFLITFADESFGSPQLRGTIGQGYTGAGNFDVGGLDVGDFFGSAVSIDGQRLAIGAPGDDGANDDRIDSGAVYLFTFADAAFSSPVLEARMGADYTGSKNIDIANLEAEDQFGSSVALMGNQLAVGAQQDDGNGNSAIDSGAVYLYTFANAVFNDGTLQAIAGAGYIGGQNYAVANLEAGDGFGSAVALSADGFRLAVGAYLDDGDGNSIADSGAVYLLGFDNTAFASPTLIGTIGSGYTAGANDFAVASLGSGNRFGTSLGLSGAQLVVGAPGDAGFSGGGLDVGAAYLFGFTTAALDGASLFRRITAGSPDAAFLSIDGLNVDGNRLGTGVAIDGSRMVIGAAGNAGNTDGELVGAAYLFTFSGAVFDGLAQVGTIGSGYAAGSATSLAANGIAENERFGASVSLDGQRLAIGSSHDSGASNLNPFSGAVYLFTFADPDFASPVLESVIGSGYSGGKNLSVANLERDDLFGVSVSLDGSVLAVGAMGDDGAGNIAPDSGAVYLFNFADPNFSAPALQATIGRGYAGAFDLDPGMSSEDLFGHSVALDGTRLAVGAPGDDGFAGDREDSGAVYLFNFAGAFPSTISPIGIIGAGYTGLGDIDVPNLEMGDAFGTSVALDGRALVAGAPFDDGAVPGIFFNMGAVYTFTFADDLLGGGTLRSTIGFGYTGSDDLDLGTLDGGDWFGEGVSLNGNRLAVGAQRDDGAGNNFSDTGAVYLFGFANSEFAAPTQQAIIGAGYSGGNNIALPLGAFDNFGVSVSLDGDRLVAGSTGDDGALNSKFNAGAVYLFSFADSAFSGGMLGGVLGAGYRTISGLELASPPTASSVQVGTGDAFGQSVSLDGNRLAIGAPGDDGVIDGLTDAGAVYLFSFADLSFGGATLEAIVGHGYVGGKNLWPLAVEAGDSFGSAVSLDGNQLAVGAPNDAGISNTQGGAGAVYLFSFADSLFGGGMLEAVLGIDYGGGKNIAIAGLDPGDQFGASVSLNTGRLAVGAPGDDGAANGAAETGAVYLFTFANARFGGGAIASTIGAGYSGGLNVTVALDDFDNFGSAVALDSTRLAIGAPRDAGSANNFASPGAVYLFTFDDLGFGSAVQRGIVGAGYTGAGDLDTTGSVTSFGDGGLFGNALALDGTRLVVGAPGFTSNATSPVGAGAVYLLTFADTNLSLPAIVDVLGTESGGFGTTSDLGLNLEAGDGFGTAVSLDGDRLVAGAGGDDGFGNTASNSGGIYLLTFADTDFNGGELRGNLGAGYTRGVSTPVGGVQGLDAFGWALSLDGTRLAVGAPQDRGANGQGFAGAVYLFTFANLDFDAPMLEGVLGEGYVGGKNLDVPGLAPGGAFGGAVSLDGNRLAVGASNLNGGSVFLFTFADAAFSTPALASFIGAGADGPNELASPAAMGDVFGYSVALDGNRLAVGAPLDDGAGNSLPDSGAVYLFSFADSVFTDPALDAVIGAGYIGGKNVDVGALDAEDHFGTSVSLQGLRLVVGAELDDGFGNVDFNTGAAYLFAMSAPDFSSVALAGTIGRAYTGAADLNISRLQSDDWFGRSVSLDGDRLAIGAINDSGLSETFASSGAVYLVGFADASFGGPALLSILGRGYDEANDVDVSSLETFDGFGNGVSLDTGRLVVGAPRDDGPENTVAGSGATYFFNLTGSAGDTSALGFGDAPGADVTISASDLAALLSSGTAVELQANNDITVSNAIAVNNIFGNGGALTFRAGRSIFINAAITTDSGNFTAFANDFAASGVVDAFRDPGDAVISFGTEGRITTGSAMVDLAILTGDDKTFSTSGGISVGSISARSISIRNLGVSGNRAVTINAGALLTAATAGDAILIESDVFTNNAGAMAFNLVGGGRFLIYSDDYEVIDRGGLVGNNLYNNVSASGFAGNLFIFARQPVLTFTADDATRTYGEAAPAYSFQLAGLVNGDSESYAFSGAPNLFDFASGNAGVDSIFIDQGSLLSDVGYGFDFVGGALTTLRALLTARADDQTREYGTANPAFTVTYSGFVNGDDESVILFAPSIGTIADITSDAGSYAIDLGDAFADNYEFDYIPGTLTITKALLSVTADDAIREYGLADPTFTGSITGFRNGDDDGVVSGLVYGSSALITSDAGLYSITGAGANATNYDFAYVPGTLTITKALLTVTADDATREYGLADPSFTGSIAGLRNGDDASVISGLAFGSTAVLSSGIGTYAITGLGASATNYDFSYVPGTLTITRALLTVTADDAAREYGLANPALTGTISGLRAGDTASVVSGLVYDTVASIGSDVGAYTITGSGGAAANYDFSYVPGTLTITRAQLTVTADDATREYGLANPAFTSTITGLRNGDTSAVVSGLVLSTPATIASGVGTYGIDVSGGSALNYDFAYAPGTLAITPALLTVSIDDKTRIYGGVNPTLTASITGFRNGDTDAVVSGLRLRTVAISRSNVGDYLITGSGANAANYRFDYVPGTLTITKALLQVRVNNASREYGLDNPAFTAMITGFRNGDNANVVSGLAFGTPATIGSDVGNYAITASGASALNYDFVYTPGRLLIDQARLLVTANSLVIQQGSGDPVLTVSYSGLRNGDTGDTGDVVTGLVLRSTGGGTSSPGQYIINASRGTARNYQITYRPGVMTVLPPIVPPAQDPPVGGAIPPAANPPAPPPPGPTPPSDTPPAPPPPGGGTAVADPGTGTSTGQTGSATTPQTPTPGAVITMPGQGMVNIPVSPDNISLLPLLQGMSAPLPVLVAPELRPTDPVPAGEPSRGDGQRTGCAYISLCSGAPQPLWTFQPAQ
ncbi:MBG domain-containing protein [Blastomonas aquatica]|uniref:Filamentous haemagglutinin FhaB/tRNA nuclease CdiA-like TPS domain-containing protein n=1 Tax=Blastomonas aquatica TaxID=1510276 RepID=A0ABQ1IUI3_9SPHN|nr:MBG domain-containing protein [Blastomonas aquatica]GGB52149.1 hypothetical protein GCM10010833_03630 [Blastomonas aquatica]